jgi:hypothetical protein
MNKILIVLASIFLIGCAHNDKASYSAPSVVAVKTSVEKVRQYVRPEGQLAVKELSDAIDAYQKQVDDQSVVLMKAQDDAVYWNNKHSDALKKLWWWRALALASILAVAAYIGLKTSWRFFL